MTDSSFIQSQIAGLRALRDRLSDNSFARSHVSRLHTAAEALGTIASANDGTGARAQRLADASRRYLDAIQRTKTELTERELGGSASLSQEFAERVGLQADRYANEIVQAFGRATHKDRMAWLSKIADDCDGRSLAALQQAPEFITGLDRATLGKFMGVMEDRHCPDLAERRRTFQADIEAAKGAISQASQIAESALKIDDVDSAIAAREKMAEAQAQFEAATE